MQQFITLTNVGQYPSAPEIVINTNHIKCFYVSTAMKGTYVILGVENAYIVKETPEEIRRLIFPRQQSFGPG